MKACLLTVVLALIVTACNPVATRAVVPATRTEVPFVSPTLAIPSVTVTPDPASVYPTYTPAPTSTAIVPLEPWQPFTLINIHMMDHQSGWGIDESEHIVHTVNGGHTWRDVTPPNGAYEDSGFFALDANTAWATPYQWDPVWKKCYRQDCPPNPNFAAIWHTTDGGGTWTAYSICLASCEHNSRAVEPIPDYYHPVGIQFLDHKIGWVAAIIADKDFQDFYTIYQTLDGGLTWQKMSSALSGPAFFDVAGFAFHDAQTGWLAATAAWDGTPAADWRVYQTTDSGRTWNAIALPAPDALPDVFGQYTAWCGVRRLGLVPPTGIDLTLSCFVYVGDRPIFDYHYYSANLGRSWVAWLETDQAARWDHWYQKGDVAFLDTEIGWRIISRHDNTYEIEATRDGGTKWTGIKTVSWTGDLQFVNENVGWGIVRDENSMAFVHTIDKGETWTEIKPIVIP